MKAPIAIVFANLKGNLGDFAILHAVLMDLERRFPEHPRHVMTHSCLPVDQRRFKAFLDSGVPSFTLGAPVFARPIPRARIFLEYGGRIPGVRTAFMGWLDRQARFNSARFRNYAAVFVAGGHQWNGFLGMTMLATLRAIHAMNPEIYGYPFSFHDEAGKFNTRDEIVANFRRIRAPLVVRDSQSKSVFDAVGLDAVFGSDCVFRLHAAGSAVEPRNGQNSGRIILILTDRSHLLEKQFETFVRRSPSAARRAVLMTTCEYEDDRIFGNLAKKYGIPYLKPLTWQEAVAEMKNSALVVSNRLHGLIMGSFAGVPLLPMTNRSKVEAFAHDIGSPFAVSSIGDLSEELIAQALSSAGKILNGIDIFRALNAKRIDAPAVTALRDPPASSANAVEGTLR